MIVLQDTVNDEFVLAHVVGWFAKTLLLRDAYLCLFLSIMFEIWEMTFQHQLPNFAECWWDHVRGLLPSVSFIAFLAAQLTGHRSSLIITR